MQARWKASTSATYAMMGASPAREPRWLSPGRAAPRAAGMGSSQGWAAAEQQGHEDELTFTWHLHRQPGVTYYAGVRQWAGGSVPRHMQTSDKHRQQQDLLLATSQTGKP